MLGLIIALVVTVLIATLIFKGFKSQPVLFLGGIILMIFTLVLGVGEIIEPEKATGFFVFDIFEFISNMLASRAAGIGLTIMAVSAFSKYMEHIGASKALVDISIKPIQKINSPYLILSVGYIIGQVLNIFIPSASGLGLLLMATMYPIFLSAGVSKLAATALIGTTACLDLGPASGNTNLAATNAGLESSVYFIKYQMPVAVAVMIAIAVTHFFVQKYFDKKAGYVLGSDAEEVLHTENKNIPKFYALLPLIPLVLLLVFSNFVIDSITISVTAAMIFSFAICYIIEIMRSSSKKNSLKDIQIYFNAMGSQFANVITLIVAGEVFAHGLKSIGAIETIISAAENSGFGGTMMIIVMTLVVGVSAVVMGSGNAPFFAFASLAPDIATKLSIPAVSLLLPMQFTSGLARSFSPITAVIVAVSGVSDVDPFEVVKRTMLPMVAGIIVTIIGALII